ncbi:Uncharacterised protein, partial [Mycoplasmopsis synoviae]
MIKTPKNYFIYLVSIIIFYYQNLNNIITLMSKLFIKNQLLNKHKSNLSESSIIHLNKICEKFNITNAKLYYEGFHNITYKVLINDSW